ncbi:Hydrolase, nudix family [Alteracholeplasma palmae J233]|uniref:Hydrolase, nudix family n=1 Tax=Alteracholeplasma palmae (strain ATCC 49389 / J233) TaxID=1318466 RepID=U4KL18_ALTPJ|nr:NUDIX domain-containing protein [Alteracholeplasma palmae]CCV64427.1 Hydrolase, nudix family [Alteracholeplasma palmae J233]
MNNSNLNKEAIDAFIIAKDKRFRVRSCGIIIKQGHVLMIKNDIDDYYYSVGGAIHIGETIEEACLREVFEETGYRYEIDRLQFIHENFFENNGELCHEIAFYFLMKQNDNDKFIISQGSFGAMEEKVWIPIKNFSDYKAYPLFFADELKEIKDKIKVITTFE